MGVGFNDANSQGNAASQGLNLVNLRRLGTNRTLVLVNGRRQVPGER
jgi:outer membrane receptor for ferrienterochelin and colicin